MDLLNGNIKKIYFKYLFAAFGSAMITSIYSIVDMAMVGQYHGPDGTAALAVVAPVWNIIYSLGLLVGIGGSVILSSKKANEVNDSKENQYFTISVVSACLLAILTWLCFIFFEDEILIFFGADNSLLIYATTYLKPIMFVLPLFLFNQMLAAFLRNDNDPFLATIGVLLGGLFNILGDFFFVFICDMGIFGAGLATAIGSFISFIVIITHFFKKSNSLKFVKYDGFFSKLKEIIVTGFPTFFIDAAMGIITVLFNRQIMNYLDSNALSIYGPIINVSTFVQCCGYSVGQASQPIISPNYGAGKWDRIKETLHYGLLTVISFGLFWTALSMICPNMYIYLFMSPTIEILNLAPTIIRTYVISFLLPPLNIFSTYYFQAIMKPKQAIVISFARGLLISGILIMLLPKSFGGNSIWLSMAITEVVVMIYGLICIRKYTFSDEKNNCKLNQKKKPMVFNH